MQPRSLEDHQISGRVFEDVSWRWPTWLARYSLSTRIMPPATLSPEWSYKLQSLPYPTEIEMATFFPFHALLSFLRPTSVSFAAERDANAGLNATEENSPWDFSTQNDRTDRQRFLHRLDINERTSKSYRRKRRWREANGLEP